jgi:MoxR-like ATPase
MDVDAGSRPHIPPVEDFLKDKIALESAPGVAEQVHVFDRESAQAIRAALAARRPLLVRGEPGVGKTQLAAAAAKVLGRPLVSRVVDSRTESRDLLWTFDAVMRLADAQVAAALLPSGQGATIVPASGSERHGLPPRDAMGQALEIAAYLQPGPLWWGFDWNSASIQEKRASRVGSSPTQQTSGAPELGRVVLIDEIDKADSDLPNGLLEALGSGTFTPPGHPPVTICEPAPLIIITTNEERILPAAFIRRCLVLTLTLPEKTPGELTDFLVNRGTAHFPTATKSHPTLLGAAAQLLTNERAEFRRLRLRPLPGQAEYLDLVRAVLELSGEGADPNAILESVKGYVLRKQEESSP